MKFFSDAIDTTFKKQHDIDERNLIIIKNKYKSLV
jgi:hypothetical protein